MNTSFLSQRFLDNMRFIGIDVALGEDPHYKLTFRHRKSKAWLRMTPEKTLRETVDMLREIANLSEGADRSLLEDIIFALNQESN